MGHLPNTHRYLGHTSEPLTPAPVALGLGLGLRGPDLGLGLDNYFEPSDLSKLVVTFYPLYP